MQCRETSGVHALPTSQSTSLQLEAARSLVALAVKQPNVLYQVLGNYPKSWKQHFKHDWLRYLGVTSPANRAYQARSQITWRGASTSHSGYLNGCKSDTQLVF